MKLAGFDIGSATVKAVVVEDGEIRWQDYQRHHSHQAEKALEFLSRIENEAGFEPHRDRIFFTGSGAGLIAPLVGARVVQEEGPGWLHPGRAAQLARGKEVFGWFGEVHPRVARAFDLEGTVAVADVDLDLLRAARGKTGRMQPISRFPTVPASLTFRRASGTESSGLSTVPRHCSSFPTWRFPMRSWHSILG